MVFYSFQTQTPAIISAAVPRSSRVPGLFSYSLCRNALQMSCPKGWTSWRKSPNLNENFNGDIFENHFLIRDVPLPCWIPRSHVCVTNKWSQYFQQWLDPSIAMVSPAMWQPLKRVCKILIIYWGRDLWVGVG